MKKYYWIVCTDIGIVAPFDVGQYFTIAGIFTNRRQAIRYIKKEMTQHPLFVYLLYKQQKGKPHMIDKTNYIEKFK